jgi:hypothetical protein
MGRGERWFAIVFSTVVISGVLSPLGWPKDDFPLSTYPMFSSLRPTSETVVYHAVGFTSDGSGRPIPPRFLGTDEVMQASQTIKRALTRRSPPPRVLCWQIAAELAERADSEWVDIERLELRVDRYDAVRYWAGERRPIESQVVERCVVAEHS